MLTQSLLYVVPTKENRVIKDSHSQVPEGTGLSRHRNPSQDS